MPRPIAGKQYTIVNGDTLSKIAGIVYGDIYLWPIIYRANIPQLQSGDKDLIYPGEVIWIPPKDFLQFPEELPNKGKEDLTIVVDGVEIPIISARVLRTVNSASDMWTASIAWNPGDDKKLDDATRPYQYSLAAAYVGGKLKVGGILYGVEVAISASGRSKILTGYSFTADAIDSNLKPPYEANQISLKKRATDLLNPLGVSVEFQDGKGDEIFSRVTASPNDTIFSHLAKLAAQRNLLVSSNNQGNVVFLQANTTGKSIGSIEEGADTFGLEYSAKFDGRKLFNAYKVLTKTPLKTSGFAVSKDNNVNRPRSKNIQLGDIISGEAQKAADWERSKAQAEALTIPFPVSTWYGPDDKLWAENTLVTVKSPTLFIDEGYTFLIQKVEFIYEYTGIRAMLSLVPPQVYTGEELDLAPLQN